MPAERLSMRKVREVLRLKHVLGLSYRKISEATGVGKTQVAEYARRAEAVGIGWPVPEGIDDVELERRLFPVVGEGDRVRPAIDWPAIQNELKRRGVTLLLLWQEYLADQPTGYSYTRFCELHKIWRQTVSATMRQTHLAGERLFVDWAGDTIGVVDPATGEEHRARIFVAALGASNFTYAEARWTETLPDWIGAHVNALAAIGGVPQALVPDNLKAGITKPSRYEPGINRTYQDLADHYGCVVLPTRIVKPRDKAKVEVAVQIVERFVLAKLRNRTFFSLAELNTAIRECVAAINAKVMRRVGKSRAELLEALERPALKGLPGEPYAYAEWKRARVAPDYHIEIADHFYSVPSKLIREIVDARITSATVEIFHKGQRIASHAFSAVRGRHTTTTEHMPSAHRRYAEWTPARMMSAAAEVGPATVAMFEAIMKSKPHPEQGFRSCLGIISLVKSHGAARVEAACRRGNHVGSTTYGSIASILGHGLDRAFAPEATPEAPPLRHDNIRGPDTYH
ncbi:MAG: IS21 family transposase [Hyphomicrobiaceae bacterium]